MKTMTNFFEVSTRGKGLYDITARVGELVAEAGCGDEIGRAHV